MAKSTKSGASSKITPHKAREETLEAHNKYRAMHDAEPLRLDDQLTKMAQEWSDHLYGLGKNIKLDHSKYSKKYGEMMHFRGGEISNPPTEVINNWYGESKIFDWGFINHQKGTGHMTQIIWKGSERIGVGYTTGPFGTVLVVLYDPPGNNITAFRKNISPPKGWKPTKPKK